MLNTFKWLHRNTCEIIKKKQPFFCFFYVFGVRFWFKLEVKGPLHNSGQKCAHIKSI